MENFTPVAALAGGAMIGFAAVLFMWLNGRIAGVSSIVGGLIIPDKANLPWRAAFIIGLISAPILYGFFGGPVTASIPHSSLLMLAGGLLVGIGTQLGSGCTSGHGVCGVSRFSMRSVAATFTFLATGILTVFLVRHLLGWG